MTYPEHDKPESAAGDNAQQAGAQQDAQQAGGEESAPGEEPVEESLESRLEAAQAEIEKFRDAALRAEAEMQNVRRRAERDVENAHKFGLDRFVQNLLPVVDSLEKAIEAAENTEDADSASNKAIIEGVGLCLKMLLDTLGKEGVAVIDPEGEPFDPNLHQAMAAVENANMEPNSVIQVVQCGYQLNERLVRPAMVMVSKAPTAPEKSE